jgi:hypothetical protein
MLPITAPGGGGGGGGGGGAGSGFGAQATSESPPIVTSIKVLIFIIFYLLLTHAPACARLPSFRYASRLVANRARVNVLLTFSSTDGAAFRTKY